ncbi:MAG: condensation domain-containing protein, partial [Proteobacteria bacterium]|nr:condensation domain-containing protein [Pseudomonadota bacterium]
MRDDFFRLGGDSIVSIQLVSRLRQQVGLQLSIKNIFDHKTIERLYENVLSKEAASSTKEVIKTEQGRLEGEAGLLPIQEWFFKSKHRRVNHWNQSFIVKIPELDIKKLQNSVDKLIAHHDALRLRYRRSKGNNYVQYYDDEVKSVNISTLDIHTLVEKEGTKKFKERLEELLTSWQNNFHLEKGPMFSIGYLYGYKDGSARICLALHHLIVDAVSWRILVDDLHSIYEGKDLGLKGSSYRQWVEAVKEYGQTNIKEKDYWSDILKDSEESNNKLLRLVASEEIRSYSSLELDREQTRLLLQESGKVYNTEINDILLTAFGYTLSEITGSKFNHIVLEGHGREEIDGHIDITRTVGWFTTMYPIRLEVLDDIGNSIKQIKESLRVVPNKGIGYGAIVGYEKKNLPKISFNYLGQFDKEGKDYAEEEIWRIVGESSGISVDLANQDNNIININGLVVGGKLKFSIASKLDKENTNRLARIFSQKLEEIVNYTVSQERSYLTVSDVGNIISQEYLDKLQKDREIRGVYLANSLQEGFIYHALNQGDIDDAYKIQLIWEYNHKLDPDKLKQAWSYAQVKYPTLRLRFAWDKELLQVIDKKGDVNWRYIDLTKERQERQVRKIRYIQEEDRLEPYNLDKGNLFRVYIIKQRNDLYTCIFSNHHAISDGWSTPILLGYIHETYRKLLDKESIKLSIDYSYEDAQKYLQKSRGNGREYWDNYIGQIEDRVDIGGLLTDKNKSIRISEYKHIKNPQEEILIIKNELYSKLKDISHFAGITVNAILQYVWHRALSIYGNNKQTVVGTIISGRNLPIDNIESSVGLYINTLPLVVNHGMGSVIDVVKKIQEDINEINVRNEVSLSKLQSGGERLFDSLFVYENYPNPTGKEGENELKIRFKESIEKLDYPLAVIAYEGNKKVIFKINYAGELFEEDLIKKLLLVCKKLLEQIVDNPQAKIEQLSYLPEEQYAEIVYKWNETEKEYPSNKTIHELFEEQVERGPDRIAVVYEGIQLSYRELNERSNQLAYYLREEYGVKADTLVALCLDRSEHMLFAILAVLKAGGAYVPMDPSYPDERVRYILEDTQAKVVLSNEKYKKRLKDLISVYGVKQGDEVAILAVDVEDLQRVLLYKSNNNPMILTTSDNLAYAIYTSGTTGNPKGVMIGHKGVVNLVVMQKKEFNLATTENKKHCLSYANYVFDAHASEMYISILSGHKLYLVNDMLRQDAALLARYMECNDVNIATLPPALFNHENVFKLDTLIVAGESTNKNFLDYYKKKDVEVINAYGPSEITVCTSLNHYKYNGTKNIGAVLGNMKCYALNNALDILPIGAVGELYVGGVGLA